MFSRLRSFLATWTRREGFEESLDEEVRFHLEAHAEDLIRAGVPAGEAWRRARVHFGSVEGVKDGCRQAYGLRLADEAGHVMTNIRLALRMLLKTPVVTRRRGLVAGPGHRIEHRDLLPVQPAPAAPLAGGGPPTGWSTSRLPDRSPDPAAATTRARATRCSATRCSVTWSAGSRSSRASPRTRGSAPTWPIRAAPPSCRARRSRARTSRPWACCRRPAACSVPRSTGRSEATPSSSSAMTSGNPSSGDRPAR